MVTMPRQGYFPPGSMLRRVQEQRAVGQTYGQRALVMGATYPVPYVGTSSSTLAKERPFARLAATARAFESIFFGDRDEADAVLASVHRMHTRVRGVLPQDEGNFPAGTPYDAFDPDLMFWTMAVLADSSRVCHEALVGRLTAGEEEDLWADWVRFGTLFGMPAEVAPPTAEAFREWMHLRIEGPDFHVTDEARVVGRAIVRRTPVPTRLRAGSRATNLVVVGLLPPRVRTAFGLRWTPAHAAVVTGLTAAVRTSHHFVPEHVRVGRNTELFELVARTERSVIDAGGRTIDLPIA